MKKLFILGSALAVLSLSSCKKEWTCECEIFGEKFSDKTEKMSKKDAKKLCEDGSLGMCKIK